MISAIIVNYYSCRLTLRAVKSLLPPGQDVECGIWVVDNTPDPEEHHWLKTHLPGTCHLIINDRNLGFAKACNQAYAQTTGEWVLLLNPDAHFYPGTLNKLLNFLDTHPCVGAVSPRVFWDDEAHFFIPPNPTPGPWCDNVLSRCHPLSRYAWWHSLWWRRGAIRLWRSVKPMRQKSLCGGHVLLRRSALEKVGGLFDPDFFVYYEDTDLFLRLQKGGYQLYILPFARAGHQYNQCGRDCDDSKRKMMEESYQVFQSKHFGKHPLQIVSRHIAFQSVGRAYVRLRSLGVLSDPPTFTTEKSLARNWLLEWSPNINMVSSFGYFGTGERPKWPQSAWRILRPGDHYVRISHPDRFWVKPQIWHWKLGLEIRN